MGRDNTIFAKEESFPDIPLFIEVKLLVERIGVVTHGGDVLCPIDVK